MQQNNLSRTLFIGITVVSILSLLLPLFTNGYLGTFARYEADDFCTAGILRQKGFWPAQSHWYSTWTGRFSFTFLVTLSEIPGVATTPFLPLLLILAWLSAATWTFYRIGKLLGWNNSLLLGIAFSALSVYLILFGIPDAPQVLFWQTGSLTYLVPVIGLILLLGLAVSYWDKLENSSKGPQKLLMIFAMGLLALINGGFSETSTALQISMFVLAILGTKWLVKEKDRTRKMQIFLAFGLGATVVSFLIMALAPGNLIRQQSFPSHPGLIELIQATIIATIKYIYFWLADHSGFLLLALLVTLIPTLLTEKPAFEIQLLQGKNFFSLLIGIVAATFLLIASCFTPALWAMSQMPYDRVLILPAFIMVFTIIALTYIGGLLFVQIVESEQKLNQKIWVASLLLVVLITGPVNQARLLSFQRTTAARYAQKWDERDRQILEAHESGRRQVAVPWLAENLAGLEHIQGDPNHWINNCAEWYYDMEEISGY